MKLKEFKPVTPGTRQLCIVDRSNLSKVKPQKKLLAKLTKTGGRNNYGHITTRHIGGGHKKRYRIIDFKRNKDDIAAKVKSIEYDPIRTAHIALIEYQDTEISYIIAPEGIKVGDSVMSTTTKNIPSKNGNCMPLAKIPVGSIVHCVEMKKNKGAQIARSAGTYCQLMAKSSDFAQLRLRSGEIRLVRIECKATIGTISNPQHQNEKEGKAGRNRWKGKKPTVRGVAMNPVDHPLGGGEGKTSGGRHPTSMTGRVVKGQTTRGKKNSDQYILKFRKKK